MRKSQDRNEDTSPASAPGQQPRRVMQVEPKDDGRTISDFIAAHCPEAPIGFINRLLRKGFVKIDDAVADEKRRVKRGERISLFLPEGSFLVAPNPAVKYHVVLEDETYAVIAKPFGVVTEPGIGHKLDTLLNGLIARYGESLDRLGPEHDYGLVHRLDREASGLVIVARTVRAWTALTKQFKTHDVQKTYLALLLGIPSKSNGRITIPVGRARQGGRMRGVTGGPDARNAVTTWRVVERFRDNVLVEASPETGRWHQLRLHFAAIGHPIAGDTEHSDEAHSEAHEQLKTSFGLTRMFLHAARLKFHHPVTDRDVIVEAPLPPDLLGVLKKLRQAR